MSDTDEARKEADARMGQRHVYRASRLWEFNVYGSLVAGAGGGVLVLVIALMALWLSALKIQVFFLFLAIVANIAIGWIILYPGNYVCKFPYAVEIEKGARIRLFGPLKELSIPIENIRDVQKSLLHQGYVIRLHRRQGLLKCPVIHRLFGPQGQALVQALRDSLEQGPGSRNTSDSPR